MKALADLLVRQFPGLPPVLTFVVVAVFFAVVLAVLAATIAGILSWVERRVAGVFQNRYGPNRVGPQGFFQWIADAVKLLHKEDITPAAADRPLFRAAPYLIFVGMFAPFAVIPFGPSLVPTDLNIGIFYILGITSLAVIGTLMAGWASNNKWSLLGGLRSAAQIVSYEIPSALSVGAALLMVGSFSMQEIVRSQAGGLGVLNWTLFKTPFHFAAGIVFLTSALAEINRVPFDIPEAESELVSGYNTEYSGLRFGIFFLSDWANVFVVSAVTTAAFLGGWILPVKVNILWLANLLGLIVFMIKTCALCFLIIWLRWTLPRLRVDQLMALCWKYLIPIAFVNLLGVAAWMLVFKDQGIFQLLAGLAVRH